MSPGLRVGDYIYDFLLSGSYIRKRTEGEERTDWMGLEELKPCSINTQTDQQAHVCDELMPRKFLVSVDQLQMVYIHYTAALCLALKTLSVTPDRSLQ